ncbi:hypothetical protein K488DRAFT_49643 [Vararia minispora EC-137]|uniref:Uncharacterized protein n=1 Tax=Vararia minispora EC-137 TaxID=1314806 RepID=A0ACB8QMH9_9AGAM|nr:hypothetical protein K488DRAFT_49643 [Vararia minispora EC-137]
MHNGPLLRSHQDQADHVAGFSEALSDVFGDVRDIYRDRIVLEREYAAKLQALAKKLIDKKSRKMAMAVFGAEPSKTWTEETLSESTIEAAYSKIVSSMLNSAQEHVDLADALTTQVVDPLKVLERKTEDHRKKLATLYQRLLSDRDRYDTECEEVEAYRQKQDRASDDKHAERAARQFEQQHADMLNAKNVYLINTACANRVQERFYAEDLPTFENVPWHYLELLQAHFTRKCVDLLKLAQQLQTRHHDALKLQLTVVESSLEEVSPERDQNLFIDYNIRPFTAPSGFRFEPCAGHYDTADVSVEAAPKIYLQNRLSKCRAKLEELVPLLETKRREADQATKVLDAYASNQSLGSVNDAMETYLDAQHQATLFEGSRTILEAEIKLVEEALGGDEGSQSPHQFKSSSFTIPTECAHCRTNIWGLSKQGKSCKLCGISVHAKCELKVAADCTRVKNNSKRKSENSISPATDTVPTASSAFSPRSGSIAPTPSSFAQSHTAHEDELPRARVLFDFTPTSPFELTVYENMLVSVVEEDDGSGWVKVDDGNGGRGLVPASYVELADASASPPAPTLMPAFKTVGKGRMVKGLYDYHAVGVDEIDVTEGGMIELTAGGENYAEGWWEGVDPQGKKGIFPSNYVCCISSSPLYAPADGNGNRLPSYRPHKIALCSCLVTIYDTK